MQQVHCESKRSDKEVEKLDAEISGLRGYGRVEMFDIYFVPLNAYFDNQKIK